MQNKQWIVIGIFMLHLFFQKHKLCAIVVKGTDLKNLGKVIKRESFLGSVIQK